MSDSPLNSVQALERKLTVQPELLTPALGPWDRVVEHVWKPAANVAFLEPVQAVAHNINLGTQAVAGRDLLPEPAPYKLRQTELLTMDWGLQNMSSGLAMVVPYGIAAILTRKGLMTAGTVFGAEGRTATVLANKHVATILGAGLYDGFKVPKENESRLGNAIGGMAGFSVFEGGNYLVGKWSPWKQIPARMMIGSAGALTHASLSRVIATGAMPKNEELWQAAVTGSFMNLALPYAHKKMEQGFNSLIFNSGRTVPLEYLLAAELAKSDGSPTVKAMVEKNPLALGRKGKETRALTDSNTVEVAPGTTVEKIGQELAHLNKNREGTYEQGFKDAAEMLTRDSAAAKEMYLETRLRQEFEARLVEQKIAGETGRSPEIALPEKLDAATRARILGEKVSSAKDAPTYEQLWKSEFETFQKTNGTSRPTVDYGGTGDQGSWQAKLRQLETLPSAYKIEMTGEIGKAPESLRLQIWRKLFKDGDAGVRLAAIEKLGQVPESQRYNAWLEAVHSSDPHARALAVSRIGDLPAAQRLKAFQHSLSQDSILSQPRDADVPRIPDNVSPRTKELLASDPRQLLLEQLSTIRGTNNKLAAWHGAFNDARTKQAALSCIESLPESSRWAAYEHAWRSVEAMPVALQPPEVSVLVSQIHSLPPHQRLTAWRSFVESGHEATGSAAAKALASLPDRARPLTGAAESGPGNGGDVVKLQQWRSLLERVAEADKKAERAGKDAAELAKERGVTGAIEGLPEPVRASAWHEAWNRLGPERASGLTDAIQHLPAADRLAALTRVAEAGPNPNLPKAVWSVPPSDMPALLRVLQSVKDVDLRNQCLEQMPVVRLDAADPRTAATVIDLLKAADASPEVVPAKIVQKWLDMTPELPVPDGAPASSPIRQAILEGAPVRTLARVLLGDSRPDIAQRLADSNPQVVREVLRDLLHLRNDERPVLTEITSEWLNTGSLDAVAKRLTQSGYLTDFVIGYDSLPLKMIESLSRSKKGDQAVAVKNLVDAISSGKCTHEQTRLMTEISAAISAGDHSFLQKNFIEPLHKAIGDSGRDYHWRLRTASELGRLVRSGRAGDIELRMPDLRMPRIEISEPDQARLRETLENALHDDAKLAALLGDGELGRLFPTIFGHAEQGGIVGRQAAGAHEFTFDAHTRKMLRHIRENPEFGKLSPADQVNLLLAGLIHDTGKRAGSIDPGHEWVSANLGHGVLSSLGYPPERVQRIMNLVTRHVEVSFDPAQSQSARLQSSPEAAADLAVYYRHPAALKQLLILNQADIQAITRDGSLWNQHVQAEINRIAGIVGKASPGPGVPLLTTALPNKFGVFSLTGDYAVLGHSTAFLERAFLHQLSLVESPEYSLSTSLFTSKNQRAFVPDAQAAARPDVPLVVLVTGPMERISQAGRSNLSTGTESNWKDHVKLSTNKPPEMTAVLAQVEAQLRARAQEGAGPRNLREMWNQTAQFSSLTELMNRGSRDPLVRAQLDLIGALTSTADGKSLPGHNEVKINNASVVGLGILRQGKTVQFEGLPAREMNRLLGDQVPSWVVPEPRSGTIVIPKSVWQEAMRRNLPIVSLD